MIYRVVNKLPAVGGLEEILKWIWPIYSAAEPKAGAPIHLERFGDYKVAAFSHCQTNMVENFKTRFEDKVEFAKNSALVASVQKELPINSIALCIELALTCHLRKSK